MNESPNNQSGGRILRWLFLTVGAVALFFAGSKLILNFRPFIHQKNFYAFCNLITLAFFLWMLMPLIRKAIALERSFFRWLFTWRIMRRTLIGLAIFGTLVAIFYTEEDWRGKWAWENCKHELEAKGAVLDWNKYIPPPIPDDQNFFTASPNILLRFVKQRDQARMDAAAQLPWLRLGPSGSNTFSILNFSKTNSPVVAELTVLLSGGGKNDSAINLNDSAAHDKIQNVIRATVGRSANGAQGFQFSELPLSQLSPAQIILQADAPTSAGDLEKLIPPDLVSNIGRLAITMSDAPKMFQVRFVSGRVTAAADYLKWSDQYVPAFDEVRAALKRPCAIIPGDYSVSHLMPIPNFVTMRMLAQTLAQRVQCHLLLGDPDQALRELTLMHDSCRILEKPPTGKPMTLVEAMINVAITGLYVATVQEGFRLHEWREPQMAALQTQLQAINLPPLVVAAFKTGQASSIHTFETTPAEKLADLFNMVSVVANNHSTKSGDTFWRQLQNPMYLFLSLSPRGWWYQNMVTFAVLGAKSVDGFDLGHGVIAPRIFDADNRDLNLFFDHKSPFRLLAAIAIPNTTKATQTLAYNQTLANLAQIACALERYRLAHGEYPETLDALMPQFIEKLPHDIIGGEPLHYRRTEDGKFLLYSVGWNETDDGGLPGTLADVKKGDWVWPYPVK